jgi:two-component system sensor histidine kinase HydH
MQRLEVAATELASDIEKVGDDLKLAMALAASTDDPRVLERDVRAIVAIAREYVALELWPSGDGAAVRVEALEIPAEQRASARIVTAAAIAAARRQPDRVHVSHELIGSPWLRVFARGGESERDPAVAVMVDLRAVLGKLHLLRGADSALLVLDSAGAPMWISDPDVGRSARDPAAAPGLASLLTTLRGRAEATRVLDRAEASRLGLPDAAAVAVARPVPLPGTEPWGLALVTSTVNLRNQERILVRRMFAAVGLVGAILIVLAAYVVRSARRSAALHERLRHVDRLAHLTDKAEKILDHIPSGVLAISEERRVTAINARLRERFGGAEGKTLEEMFAAAPRAEVDALLALIDAAAQGGEVRSVDDEDCSLFGERGRYNLHAVPLERRLPDVHMLVVAEDLRAVQRLEGQLLHSEKLSTLGVLAAGIAHEIGTPLNIARGWAERGQGVTDPAAQADIHRLVIEQIDHVSALIGQLLDFVRPHAVAVEAVDVHAAVQGAVALLGAEAHRRDVSLVMDAPARLPAVLADARQLQQVLVNLIVNALDACQRRGRVIVRAREDDESGWLRVDVADDGCGIPRAHRNQIFDPFFTTKKRGRGTGLGLTVVDQLVRNHGGRISVDSEPGRGTTIGISLPTAGELS